MNGADLFQVIVSGLAMGCVYTLMGNGLFMTFLTTRALNFGQGDFLMIGAFVGMTLAVKGLPAPLVALGTLACIAGLGLVLERVAIRPLESGGGAAAGSLSWVLTTMGFGMILQNTATVIWGKSNQYSPHLLANGDQQVVTIFGARLFVEELAVAMISLVLFGLLYGMLFHTRWGRAIAAVSFDKPTASLLAIDVRRMVRLSYVVMAVLAGVAGLLVGPISSVQAHMGLLYVLKGFAVVSIGGFTHPVGILLAGLGFGVVESISNYIDSSFGDLYPFIAVLLLLVVKPSGLFGENRTDVR